MAIEWVKLYECGYCTHPEKIVHPKAGLKPVKFPATVALIKHETKGYILFDTGYAQRFLSATEKFPYSLYRKLTPVFFSEEQAIVNQLAADGITPDEITTIILSHFHGDHTAGLKDFPQAEIITFRKGYEDIENNSKLRALTKGCLLDLLPADFKSRVRFIDDQQPVALSNLGDFHEGFTVIDDDVSIVAVDLTGHAIGQFGIFIRLKSGKVLFLCADAVWSSRAYEKLVYPHIMANLLIADKRAYVHHIQRLHSLMHTHPDIDILPTHCQVTWNKIQKGEIYE
ncbi:MBL fold metallo-hydrolase [Cytobacillus gottheilii]|uniref:MBL fold metallo-hydrolase n=1 Tax=Cytobacillus gottheilii TaxID=859144 RepID=UPI0009BC651B|nr:MBL fold metallo-hydrolase [Cytobacillus gottheilii]